MQDHKTHSRDFSIGFVVNHLGPNQTSYGVIKACNECLSKYNNISPSIYYVNQSIPCIKSIVPRYPSYEIRDHVGMIIATSVETALLIQQSYQPNRYKIFYIDDLHYLRNSLMLKSKYNDIMLDSDIVKICRSQDHAKELMQLGYSIHNKTIPYIKIESFLEMLNGTEEI
ncbi:MAG: hypothetical protein BAJALOKI3v1_50110 [Promethearchaeota archaeon]|nr:MAG: hypothetical protein BAJALOKI3v1_50110 [Candidatus Lokiarchaeota archaeon]